MCDTAGHREYTMPPKGTPRSCSKCLYKHPPPTGSKCNIDLNQLTLQQMQLLEKATQEELVAGENSASEEEFDMHDLREALEQQRGEINGVHGQVDHLSRVVEDLNRSISRFMEQLTPPGSSSAGAGAPAGGLPGRGSGFLPSEPPHGGAGAGGSGQGGGGSPSGPLLTDSETTDSGSSDDDKKKKKAKKVYSVRRYLPVGVIKPENFAQLLSALSRLQSHHVERGTPFAANIARHLQFLSDRTATSVHDFSYIVQYDAAVRRKAERLGAEVFVYGDQELMNQYLSIDSLQMVTGSAGDGGAGRSASSKRRQKKKSARRSRDGPDLPCWYYNYGTCTANNCEKVHSCYVCLSTDHKQSSCPNVRRSGGPGKSG